METRKVGTQYMQPIALWRVVARRIRLESYSRKKVVSWLLATYPGS